MARLELVCSDGAYINAECINVTVAFEAAEDEPSETPGPPLGDVVVSYLVGDDYHIWTQESQVTLGYANRVLPDIATVIKRGGLYVSESAPRSWDKYRF